MLRALSIGLKVEGLPPNGGLLVANHISYLDVVAVAAACPVVLVSKVEVGKWPVFGVLARIGGTLFVDRSSRESAEACTAQIAERLRGAAPVIFPEGTSNDGSKLQRFRSRFFTPATDAELPVTTAAIRYIPSDGSPERELCWFGDASFVPHLLKVLNGPHFTAEVRFGHPRVFADRREAADQTWAEIDAARREWAGL
jgi:1-acyl-sn-glycerol-3-phosphate acyltransferase